MAVPTQAELLAVVGEFQIPGAAVSVEPFGSGHINDTWRVTTELRGKPVRYTLQRINAQVFQDPSAVMENLQRVTAHLAQKLAGQPDAHRRALTLIAARDGAAWHQDQHGNHWRAYLFIEKARTYDVVESPEQARQAAGAFGRFQRLLADLPPPRLHDTIPDFHNTPKRLTRLQQAIEVDRLNRAKEVKPEIEFALERKHITTFLLAAGLPERVIHNDTKLNNVLLDETTHEALCVIDLDTVMPGLALYDFGDMVRTTTSPAAEDERDLSRVTLQLPMFEALLCGYLGEVGGVLTRAEQEQLAFAGQLITFETGLRFLTDFLEGDTYFKVHRPRHNLDRCRTQFKLVESMEQHQETMEQLVERCG